MKLIIGGDLVPTKINDDIFSNGNIEELVGIEVHNICRDADISIFNLEVPLFDKEEPIAKCGPNLLAPTSTINGIKQLNPSLLTLANNHILDHGKNGLDSTIEILNQYDIPYIGAGDNIESASKPYIIKKNNFRIGVYACAQHEFTIATKSSSGANPFDPLETLDHIQELKLNCDYLVVLYHGGKEHYRYPTPYLQKICRKMVEKGADLVVCQHSHCIGALENYCGGNIIYGQGNFLFNEGVDNEFWNTGLLLQIDLSQNKSLDFIPVVKNGKGIRLANNVEKENILGDFYRRSSKIKQENFIEEEYSRFINKQKRFYLGRVAGFNRITRKLNSILNDRLLNYIYNRNNMMSLRNCIESEDHREILISITKDIDL